MFIIFIKKYLYLLRKEHLTTLIGYTLVMTVITSLSFYYFEVGQKDSNIKSIYDSFWWSIVTFTTVGYGDIYPVTAGGKVVATFAMIFGIGFVGTFMASIASIMIQARTKELRGMKKLSLTDHLIICGYNKQKVERFIMEFRSDVQFQDLPIVIVSDSIEYHPLQDMPHVHFIQGETTDEATLQRAGIKKASKVIVIAESNQDTRADEKTILTVLLVEELNPDIYTCAEVISPTKKNLLQRAHCNEVITISEISVNLMVQALQDPGTTRIIDELISNSFGQQFHKSLVDPNFINQPFKQLVMESLDQEHIVFALEREGECMVNPRNDTLILNGDAYFYISKHRAHR